MNKKTTAIVIVVFLGINFSIVSASVSLDNYDTKLIPFHLKMTISGTSAR